jgi:hypothetical protein
MAQRMARTMTKLTYGYEPAFDFTVDMAYGKAGEAELVEFFNAVQGAQIEVKSDRYRNGRMAIETQQKPAGRDWQDSGINVTTAQWWAYRFGPGAFTLVSVPRLKKYLRLNREVLQKRDFAAGSDNPSRGFVLMPEQVQELMTSDWYDQ